MRYYVNKNAQPGTGDHEVHVETCSRLPDADNRINLGDFSECSAAVEAAKGYYDDVNGCSYCSPACHTT